MVKLYRREYKKYLGETVTKMPPNHKVFISKKDALILFNNL